MSTPFHHQARQACVGLLFLLGGFSTAAADISHLNLHAGADFRPPNDVRVYGEMSLATYLVDLSLVINSVLKPRTGKYNDPLFPSPCAHNIFKRDGRKSR